MSKARKHLEDYDVENAGAFELSVVMLGYLRQNGDDESAQQRALEGILNRWRRALESKASPALIESNKRIAAMLKEATDTLREAVEELNGET